MFIYIHVHLYVYARNQDVTNSKNWKDFSYHTFQDMLTIGQKSKKNYDSLPLSTKRQGIMCDEKRKTCQFVGKERKKKSLIKSQGFEWDCLMCIFY